VTLIGDRQYRAYFISGETIKLPDVVVRKNPSCLLGIVWQFVSHAASNLLVYWLSCVTSLSHVSLYRRIKFPLEK
jgi:hypothetical protein